MKKYPDSIDHIPPLPLPGTRLSDVAPPRFRCTACGKKAVTVSRSRCVSCLQEPMRFCPDCNTDLTTVIDQELLWRVRTASWDLSEGWRERGSYGAYVARQRVMKARRDWEGQK